MLSKNNESSIDENNESITSNNTQIMKNESKMLNSPMISIEKVEKILEQMKKSVCEINNFLSKCTGFFCKIKIGNNKEIIALITVLHGIENSSKIYLRNKEETKLINLDDSRIIYNDANFDISIIEIKPSDKINYPCLELDEKYYKENCIDHYSNKPGYILGYPCEKECTFSFGKIKVIKEKNKTYIQHFCSSFEGNSGSPIILLDSLKCIGIHLQGWKYYNRGNFLFSSVDSFINKYKKSYLTKSSNNILKNMEDSFYINLKKNKLKLDSPIDERKEKLLVDQSSFYKNQLNNSCNIKHGLLYNSMKL